MKTTVFVYTEQETSPRFFEVLGEIKKASDVEAKLVPVSALRATALTPETPVLVFGKIENPDYTHTNNIFTYSPAQVLTKANALTVVSSALQRAAGRQKPYQQSPGKMVTFGTGGQIPEDLYEAEYLVVDIETSGNIRLGTPEDEDVKLLTVAVYNPETDTSYVWKCGWYGEFGQEQILALFLTSTNAKLIWHNGKFDVRVLERTLKIRVRVDHDTMLMHHVLNQAAGNHALKDLCKLYFGAVEWEADVKKYTVGGGHYENIPAELLARYNAHDVYWTWVLFKYLLPQIEADEHAQNAYKLELAAAEFLLKVEQRGIPFDNAAAKHLATECKAHTEVARKAIQLITDDGEFNPNSPLQVKAWLWEQGERVTGTSVDIIEGLLEETESPAVKSFCEMLLKHRKYNKIASTYVKGWKLKERGGVVRPTFLVHGTSTGRLSSTGPNSQNVPRDKKVRAIVGLTRLNSEERSSDAT